MEEGGKSGMLMGRYMQRNDKCWTLILDGIRLDGPAITPIIRTNLWTKRQARWPTKYGSKQACRSREFVSNLRPYASLGS